MSVWDVVKDVAGPVTGLIGDVFGGIMGSSSAKDANKANLKAVREQMAFQKEFAQHGLRWKIDDAATRGIHPLIAVGAQPQSSGFVKTFDHQPESKMQNMPWSRMGQNISNTMGRLSRLELALKQEELKQARQTTRNMTRGVKVNEYGMPIGLTEQNLLPDEYYIAHGGVKYEPSRIPMSSAPGRQAGVVPMYRNSWVGKDEIKLIISEPVQEGLESSWYDAAWDAVRRGGDYLNKHLARLQDGRVKKRAGLDLSWRMKNYLPKAGTGRKWQYDVYTGTFKRVDIRRKGGVWYNPPVPRGSSYYKKFDKWGRKTFGTWW